MRYIEKHSMKPGVQWWAQRETQCYSEPRRQLFLKNAGTAVTADVAHAPEAGNDVLTRRIPALTRWYNAFAD